ncbi:MAG TPA: N-acetyltransferase [Beijerinckiaceae bacterium]|nr:N-acetyltransferase [Rhodoblastus sp.]MCB9997419.1 N-acetyltransferase [Methylobacteriaceae bacterium]MCC2101997.1 N-acetyltransferase [Hyphomicrobiales bacterium]HRY03242.1 N-acetyltransferase [Beijerinckiaceae bacterium]MCB1525006.1 N-acetyltransferase [Rhodoblastus sp.]
MTELAFSFSPQTDADLAAIERLTEHAFGPGRFAKTAYRLREGLPADHALSFVARVGTILVGANRMTPIRVGDTPALLLGPLVVEPAFRQHGLGEKLVKKSLEAARSAGHKLVLLVGDPGYYGRMGFSRVPDGRMKMPGPVDPERLQYYELSEGALGAAAGLIWRAD